MRVTYTLLHLYVVCSPPPPPFLQRAVLTKCVISTFAVLPLIAILCESYKLLRLGRRGGTRRLLRRGGERGRPPWRLHAAAVGARRRRKGIRHAPTGLRLPVVVFLSALSRPCGPGGCCGGRRAPDEGRPGILSAAGGWGGSSYHSGGTSRHVRAVWGCLEVAEPPGTACSSGDGLGRVEDPVWGLRECLGWGSSPVGEVSQHSTLRESEGETDGSCVEDVQHEARVRAGWLSGWGGLEASEFQQREEGPSWICRAVTAE